MRFWVLALVSAVLSTVRPEGDTDSEVEWDLDDMPFMLSSPDAGLTQKVSRLRPGHTASNDWKDVLDELHKKFSHVQEEDRAEIASSNLRLKRDGSEPSAGSHLAEAEADLDGWTVAHASRSDEANTTRHAAGDKKSKPLVWLHIHKAGGTIMCKLAQQVEKVVTPNANCNWKSHDDFPNSGAGASHSTCEERLRYFNEHGFTYGQLERELGEESELCEDFQWGTMLREPMALVQSMVNFHLWMRDAFEPTRPDIPDNLVTFLEDKISQGVGPGPETGLPAMFDNFQTRYLASAFHVPVGKISEEHVEIARRRLADHNVAVGILEDMPTKGAELFEKIGWPVSLARSLQSRTENSITQLRSKKKSKLRQFTAEESEYLENLNQHDIALYDALRNA
jgi:hypothetical protein